MPSTLPGMEHQIDATDVLTTVVFLYNKMQKYLVESYSNCISSIYKVFCFIIPYPL